MFRQFAQPRALLSREVFLLVLGEEVEQVDVLAPLQIYVKIAKSTSLAFLTRRVGKARFADSTQAAHERPAKRIHLQVFLNLLQNHVRRLAEQMAEPAREGQRLDDLHRSLIPHCGIDGNRGLMRGTLFGMAKIVP